MNNFQTILVAVFLSFAVFAVLIFSGLIKIGGSASTSGLQGKIVVWGTFSNSDVTNSLDFIGSVNKNLSLSYVSKDPTTYSQDLIEAFANGNGPDLFIISPEMIKKNENFIYKIPYVSYPEKTFTDSYIDGASIYLDSEGIIGLPLVVDPMVMYYNKDILSNEGIVNPPKTWDELFTLNPKLTIRNDSGTISRSMIALGQYDNINNVKDILATLLIQNNNPIVERVTDSANNNVSYLAMLNSNLSNLSITPMEAVLKFFLEFSNISSTAYSWNRALPSSLDMFTGGKLAFYLGRASELFNIESINPNLSFDVTQIPQIKDFPTKRTFGEIYAIAVSKRSSNLAGAVGVAGNLSQGDGAKNISTSLSLPPVSRALLSNKPQDPYLFTFFDSALISRSWLDPDSDKSNAIFKELIGNILPNNLTNGAAINKAQGQLDLLLKK